MHLHPIHLPRSAQAWDRPDFSDILKAELEQMDPSQLPLQAGLVQSSHVSDSGFVVRVIHATESGQHIQVRAGIFYAGIIGGCNCADDPTPMDEINEYCEVQLEIDTRNGATAVVLVD